MEFEKQFATEESCLEYIATIRWPAGFYCPRCHSKEAWRTKRGLYHCSHCDHQVSVTAGTLFQGTRKPLRLWFRAMWFITNQKQGISALGLQRLLGMSRYKTVWTWLHKIRVAMVRPDGDALSGIVEVDETYIGGKKSGKRGRGAAGKTLVLVAVEDKGSALGRIRLRRVKSGAAASLIPAVEECVQTDSLVRTDGWNSYGQLTSKGYQHKVVRKDADLGENLLPLVNRVTSLLKKWLAGTLQGAALPSHLDYYLDEFTFRFNRRTSASRGKLFRRLIEQAVTVGPVMDEIVTKPRSYT